MGVMDEEYFHKVKEIMPAAEQRKRDVEGDVLRLNFLNKWVIKGNLDLYRTETERDWAYIVRKERRFLVYRSLLQGVGASSFFCILHSLISRRTRLEPFLLFPLFAYYGYHNLLSSSIHRFMGILNVGSEYELGAERNRIQEEYNRITLRADF